MTSKTFTAGTVIDSPWLNDVNNVVYNTFPAQSTNPTALASINGGQIAGLRNRLINGGMQIAQRGSVAISSSTSLYGGCDRWLTTLSGTTVSAVALQANFGAQNVISTGKAHQVGNVTTTGTTLVQVSQRIESNNALALYGQTVVISGKVQQQSGATRTLEVGITRATTTDNFAVQTIIGSTTLSVVNNTWVPFSYTLSLGTADTSTGLMLYMAYNGLPAQTNSQFYFADMQLEIGSVATPLEQRPYGMELALCQRYYEMGKGNIVRNQFNTGFIYLWQNYSTPKRVTPTCALVNPIYTNASGGTPNAPSTTGMELAMTASLAGGNMQTDWTASAEL